MAELYRIRRDYRFEYLWDAMTWLEEVECRKCQSSKLCDPDEARDYAEEYPMCHEVEAEFVQEPEVMSFVEDLGDAGIHCKKFAEVV